MMLLNKKRRIINAPKQQEKSLSNRVNHLFFFCATRLEWFKMKAFSGKPFLFSSFWDIHSLYVCNSKYCKVLCARSCDAVVDVSNLWILRRTCRMRILILFRFLALLHGFLHQEHLSCTANHCGSPQLIPSAPLGFWLWCSVCLFPHCGWKSRNLAGCISSSSYHKDRIR